MNHTRLCYPKLTLKSSYFVAVIGLCLLCFASNGRAQEGTQGNSAGVKENKTKSGKVGFINSEFIAIIETSDAGYEYEKLMYVDKDVEVKSKNNLSEIKEGDTVQIDYEKTTKTSQDVTKSKDVAKSVKFLKAKDDKDSSLKSGKK